MGWNATTKRVTAPVSIRTFQRAFGIFSTNVLHRIVKRAAAAGTINKWAKFKPVVYSGWSTVGELNTLSSNHANWNWRESSDWWRGDSGSCGLRIEVFTDFGSMTNQITFLYKLLHGQLAWDYVPPTQKFRMFDIIHYYGNAIKPVGEQLPQTDFWLTTQGVVEFDYGIENVDADNLTLADIRIEGRTGTPISEFYLGLLIYRGTRWWAVTSSAKLGTGSAVIHLENAQVLEGQWNVIPFLSSIQLPLGRPSSLDEAKYMSFDVQTPQQIIIHKAGTIISIVVNGAWIDTMGTAVDWELTITSRNTNPVTLTNVIVYLYATDADVPDQDPTTGQNFGETSAMTIAVPANGQVTRTGRFTPTLPKSSVYNYWVGANTDGDYAVNWEPVEDYTPDAPVG